MMKRKRYIGVSALALLAGLAASCIGEDTGTGLAADGFRLAYTIPDSRWENAADSRSENSADTRAPGYVTATGNESRVADLQLFFFGRDDHGNGTYVATLTATPAQPTTGTTERIDITYTPASGIDPATNYNVLVVANLGQYLTADEVTALATACAGRTENRVKLELLPAITAAKAAAGILNGGTALYLLMSGEAVKTAGGNMQVELHRASVRVDVEVAESKASVISLKKVQLMNVASQVPLFCDPRNVFAPDRISTPQADVAGNRSAGQLHCTESYLDTADGDPRKKLLGTTCLLLSATSTDVDYRGNTARTWYRLDLATGTDGIQYLKRNNAYTVVLKDITGPGHATPEEAYYSDAMLISGVTIPSQWNAGPEVPPQVDVN